LQQAADLFVLASEYEGYGMAYAEALACGLPVIGTTGGAIPEVVPPSAGRLVPPGDVAALTEALRALVGDRALRQRLADGAREAARALPSWKDSGVRFAQILDRLA
jgi:glycosyltransferase involved in cell wall biosynthesis